MCSRDSLGFQTQLINIPTVEERVLLERRLESLGLWQGLAALPQPLPVVQRLTSAQGFVNLPAGFPDNTFFVIKT